MLELKIMPGLFGMPPGGLQRLPNVPVIGSLVADSSSTIQIIA